MWMNKRIKKKHHNVLWTRKDERVYKNKYINLLRKIIKSTIPNDKKLKLIRCTMYLIKYQPIQLNMRELMLFSEIVDNYDGETSIAAKIKSLLNTRYGIMCSQKWRSI